MELATPPLDFIVLGLPRSGTTWVGNWLTTDRTLCLHDPFALGFPNDWPADNRLRGISCTAAALMPHWLAQYRHVPTALIVRDAADCDASLARLGLPDTASYRDATLRAPGARVPFAALWRESSARALWTFLLPSVPFDAIRYRMLRDMNVQPHGRQRCDAATMTALIGAGLLEGRL